MADGDRSRYLLGGRRVLMADLLQAGLIESGASLAFDRPRSGRTYRASVREDGRIELDDGRTFKSPSRAAIAAVGRGSFDGWYAWRLTDTGEYLGEVRSQLLDQVASEVGDTATGGDGSVPPSTAHHAFLKTARREAEGGRPLRLSVRDLLNHWGVSSRSDLVAERITTDLDNHGLATVPGFMRVGIDAEVTLAALSTIAEDAGDGELGPAEADAAEERWAPHDEVGLNLAHLPSANAGIQGIHPQATLGEAVTRMLLDDYSQLPVMQKVDDRSVTKAVTWQSIAKAWHLDREATLSDAFIDAEVYPSDTELIDVLDVLQARDFILVKDAGQRITGIVTTADVVEAYGQLASPFFLIGELDRLLRGIVAENFTIDQVNSVCRRPGGEDAFDGLSFGDYQSVLGNADNWQSLGWPLDRKLVLARLSELREVRNDIMHFNPDPAPKDLIEKVRNMIRLLRKYG